MNSKFQHFKSTDIENNLAIKMYPQKSIKKILLFLLFKTKSDYLTANEINGVSMKGKKSHYTNYFVELSLSSGGYLICAPLTETFNKKIEDGTIM